MALLTPDEQPESDSDEEDLAYFLAPEQPLPPILNLLPGSIQRGTRTKSLRIDADFVTCTVCACARFCVEDVATQQ